MKQIAVLLPILLIILPIVSIADVAPDYSLFDEIDERYQSGELSIDDKVKLQIDAIKNSNTTKYGNVTQAFSVSEADLRKPTLIIMEIKANWDQLSPETQEYYLSAFIPSATEFEYVSPSGFFRLHYDTTGIDSVHWEDTNTNNVADFVEKCAAYLDTAYYKQLDIGYLTPPSDGTVGGDSLYDIYFEEMSYYGYTAIMDPGGYAWDDYTSYIALNNDFIGFPANDDPEGDIYGAAKVTCAHEYHHAIQLAYANRASEIWFVELDATCMEDIVFEETNDNYNYLPTFFNSPNLSLMDANTHAYASFIWAMYLTEVIDTTFLVSVWEGARYTSVFEATSDSLEGNYGITQDSAFCDFTFYNYITGTRDDGLHYLEASSYPMIAIGASHNTYPVTTVNSPSSVKGYGASYIYFDTDGEEGKLRITFNGSDTREWRAYVIKTTYSDNYEIEYIPLEPITYKATYDVLNIENYKSIVLVGVNTTEYSSGALFTYKAEVLPLYSVDAAIDNESDSVVYSGTTRTMTARLINTSLVNDVFNLIVGDNLGWVTPDTISHSCVSGDTIYLEFDVSPPESTPLELHTTLTCEVVSWGDSSVVDTTMFLMKTVLQRGDMNFDGSVDISDLLYLVDYAFAAGTEPNPYLSGDWDCNNQVDISDVLAMVDYFFSIGLPCQCNPY